MPHHHVTDADIASFLARQMDAQALLAFTDRLAACDECRDRTARAPRDRSADVALGEALGLGAEAHVPELELHAFVDGTLDEPRRLDIEAHLESCSMCAAEVADLRAFVAARAQAKPAFSWRYALAAAAVLVLGVVLGQVWRTPSVTLIAQLTDEGGLITLDSQGIVEGAGVLADDEQGRVRDALGSGRLSIAASADSPGGTRGTLRGPADAPAVFVLVSPVGTVVMERQPVLQWTTAPGATRYVVTLQQEQTGELVTGPPVTAPTWTPDRPLDAGATYAWQVTATLDGVEQLSPAPPAPPARFRVLPAADAERLARLPASHLVRGVAYAHAGLLDESEREFTTLAAANPGSALVERLLQQVRTARSTPAP